MGTLFRSEEMTLLQIFIQSEAAYHIVADLGENGCIQFLDLNSETNFFQRAYSNEVKRINEMERQIRYIEAAIKLDDIKIQDITVQPKAPNPREIVNLEAHLEKTESDIKELAEGAITLKKEYYERIQQRNVLVKSKMFFDQQDQARHAEYTPEEMKHASQLNFLGGIVNRDKLFAFERMLWRIGRGTIFLRYADIDELILDPATNKEIRTTAFIVFFQGDNLSSKILKICQGFKVTAVDIPADNSIRNEDIKRISIQVEDIKNVINHTEDHRKRLLVAVAKDIQNWSIMVRKMKAIYTTMNLFSNDVSRKCLIAEGWVAKRELYHVDRALNEGSIASGSTVPSFYNWMYTKQTAPTYNKNNKFTQGFQNLIEAYSVSSYQELNPALYTIITFPFLFAIMFGDLGHGLIMMSFGCWMVLSEKKIAAQKDKEEIFSIFFGGRYIILLMGVFSIYTGFIYNDVFSKSMNVFGSQWEINREYVERFFNFSSNGTDEDTTVMIIPSKGFKGSPYLAGFDPVWQNAENKIVILNSFKMKLSIIFGVIHMMFGLSLSVINFIHLKKPSYILLDFLPKVIFFGFLFIYLVIMIFMKWLNYSAMNDHSDVAHGSFCAPNVLIYFIGMIMFSGADPAGDECKAYLFDAQPGLQKALVLISLICIPWMLIGVPLFEYFKRRGSARTRSSDLLQNEYVNIELESIPESEILPSHAHEEDAEEEETMADIMVHTGIHTIEFTLSTVSHTASYLRLWALSLAHAQLSDVLWTMVFRKALTSFATNFYGSIAVYIIFAVWSQITVTILVLMEGLSAFLHTLRLHWVEFMTKFFEGKGYAFEPFSFQRIFDAEQEAAAF